MERISAFLESGLKVAITNERHTWYADEPIDAGGSDEAPSPYELLLGSLAACTTITLTLYARHKGIDLKWVRAEYEFDRVHVEDCAECDQTETGMIERIQAHVSFGGTFSEAEQERLQQIVGRCPVHKTLTAGVKIFDHTTFISN
jgi:putative redox protein